jgi:hypothetical protein
MEPRTLRRFGLRRGDAPLYVDEPWPLVVCAVAIGRMPPPNRASAPCPDRKVAVRERPAHAFSYRFSCLHGAYTDQEPEKRFSLNL